MIPIVLWLRKCDHHCGYDDDGAGDDDDFRVSGLGTVFLGQVD